MSGDILTVKTVKRVRSVRGSALVHITLTALVWAADFSPVLSYSRLHTYKTLDGKWFVTKTIHSLFL